MIAPRSRRGSGGLIRCGLGPAGRVLRDGVVRVWRGTSLLTRFTVTGLLLTAVIGVVLGIAVGRQLEKTSLVQAAEHVADSVASEIDPFLRREDFVRVPTAERTEAIDRHVRASLHDRHIVKIKIWNPDAIVIYSTDHSIIGQRFAMDDELGEALEGHVTMDITTLSRAEHWRERALYRRLMEIYVPVRLDGERVIGAYEVYLDVNALAPLIASAQRFLWTGLSLGLGILYLALFGLVRSASERLRRQSEDLGRLEARRVVDELTTEFVSIVSHELRTPLTALVGFSELLLTRPISETEQREWTESMHFAAKRLTKLVEDLLDVSRIEDGRIELHRQPVDLKAAVSRVLTDFRVSTPAHRFDECYAESLPPLLADPDKLTQVLTNLISNAVKYSPDGGAVTVSATASNGSVRVSVADQGLGLPAHELTRIFTRFHRVQDQTRRQIPGTGLGLYITKRLVELQQGRIWAESVGPGHGSTFHVELPAAATGVVNG
jgi:signal transduction histidine kinase